MNINKIDYQNNNPITKGLFEIITLRRNFAYLISKLQNLLPTLCLLNFYEIQIS